MEKCDNPPPYPGPPEPGFNIGVHPGMQPVEHVGYQYTAQHPQVVQPVKVVVQANPTNCPGQMRCPHCQNNVVTTTEYKNGALTWLICGVVALFLCWPLCWIPFCIDACKDVEHSCPVCHNVIHIHKRL